jgi:hypothetical protein
MHHLRTNHYKTEHQSWKVHVAGEPVEQIPVVQIPQIRMLSFTGGGTPRGDLVTLVSPATARKRMRWRKR